jgi:lipopolysaccharide/colanic/teichoic acid biosynthesis glycosyltransferase
MRSVDRNYRRYSQLIVKRAFDVAVSTIALLLLSPLFLLVMMAIRLGTGGPIFSVERTYRCNNQPIRTLRFRTRNRGSVDAFEPFLTHSGLDQLPMLISVLRGEMSIVGPHRYVLPPLRIYDRMSPAFVNAPFLPGLVSFELPVPADGEGTDMDADMFYVLNWSLHLDAKVLFRHLFSKEAYIRAAKSRFRKS